MMEDQQTSEFNMAISYLGRLNEILSILNKARINRNWMVYLDALDELFSEISTEIKPEEQKRYVAKIIEMNTELSKSLSRYPAIIDASLVNELRQFRLDMMGVLKDSGLLMKMKQDRRFGV